MTSLAIVIVSYNARADLEQCLGTLRATPPEVTHEIVVIDNASSDDTVVMLRARWPDVRVLAQERNAGFAAATNTGIRATRGDLLLLLNSDTLVPAGAIDRLVERLLADRTIAVIGPRLVDASGVPELSFGSMIGPWSEFRQKLLVRLHAHGLFPIRRYVATVTTREREVDWVSGACLLVRRRAAEAVGLLDERYFMYTEDVDFCAAIRAQGGRVLFTPVVEIVHLRGRSVAAAPAASEAAYRRSQLAFYAKHHPRWVPLLRAYLRVRGCLPK